MMVNQPLELPDALQVICPIPSGQFDIIVVDPPWAYGSAMTAGKPGSAELQYKTIGNNGKEISRRTGAGIQGIINSFPVPLVAASKSALYLWTTNPKLPFAFAVMEAWGYTYKTTLTWVKTTRTGEVSRGGMGWFYRGATEHVLMGTKGGLGIPANRRLPNVIMAPTSGHSVKPNVFYDLIEDCHPGLEYLDVFSRRNRPGWTVWGDQINDSDPRGLAREALRAP
jgi:N6-adenosine-specific RNA methylase IME4